MKILVLGAGRVGSAIARDLARERGLQVAAADRAEEALAPLAADGLEVRRLDLASDGEVAALLPGVDLVVGAVPGALGFQVLRTVIDTGRDAVDTSFFPEDAFELDELARARGVRAVVDAGVAPGLGNLILGHLEAELSSTESFHCSVGGLPAVRSGLWEYKAPFSPADVIEEYVRPVRLRLGGQGMVLGALDQLERIHVAGVGELESFLTDGLRTLLRTSSTPTLVERTLRYPGHVDKVRVLRDSGFFGEAPLAVGEQMVRPVDLSVRLLSDVWRFGPGEEDLTVMRVEVVGREDGERVRHVYDLLDRYDAATATSSMARTTGYTCTALVRWLATDRWRRVGIAPPELLAAERGCLDFVLAHLADRGVRLAHHVERLPAAG
jgi:saccharopine dehydrogenase-like NADP-dependent oxidoreductase